MRHLMPALAAIVLLVFGADAQAQRESDYQSTQSSGEGGSLLGDMFSSGTKTTVTSGQGSPDINAVQMEAYDGPKARIAVARFTDKTHHGWWNYQIGDGMADQLATALFNSNRYIVLERQLLNEVLLEQDLGASGRVRQDTAAPIGQIEGAELLITGAVTEFERNAGGTQAGLSSVIGGSFGSILGAVAGGVRRAHMAIDVRVIDARTSRIVAATSVEGEASDVNLGGALGGAVTGGALHGSLGGWKNTPIEKALRICIQKAVAFIVSKTPPVYYRHGVTPARATVQAPAPAQPAAPAQARPAAPVYELGSVVRVKSERLNMCDGPSTANGVVRGLDQHTPLLVEARMDDWIRVKTQGGDGGWVAAWLTYLDPKLSPESFAAPAPAAVETPAAVAAPAPTPAAQAQPAAPAPAAAAAGGSDDDPFARLKKLKQLYEAELISKDEYAAKKQEILDQF